MGPYTPRSYFGWVYLLTQTTVMEVDRPDRTHESWKTASDGFPTKKSESWFHEVTSVVFFRGHRCCFFFLSEQKKPGGPLLVISRGEITPLIVGWNNPSETHLFSAIKKGFTFGTLMSWRLNGWGWLLSEWNVEDWSFNPKRSSSIVIGLNTCLVGGVTRTQAIAFKSLMLKRSIYNSSRKAEMERIALKQPRLRKDVHQPTHNWLLHQLFQ